MEDIGVEVSQKIRSAIKAKLVELGAYVDDELPDYIMVMVANKRTKMQMDNDLKLFLGTNTIHFTGWLHTVLQKLQEVTIASNLNKINALEPAEATTAPIKKVVTGTLAKEEDSHKHVKHKKKTRKSSESSTKKKSDLKKSDKLTKGKVLSGKIVDLKLDQTAVIEKQLNLGAELKSLDHAKKGHSSKLGSVKLLLESKAKEKPVREVEIPFLTKADAVPRKLVADVPKKPLVLKAPVGLADSASLKSKAAPMQSDEEDFEDVINIKDMEFFDEEELPDESPMTTQPKAKSPPPQEVEEVDDLEEQRANLLRDLELLEKPRPAVVCDLNLLGKPSRPTIEPYSVTKALDRQSSKMSSSILSRLGSKVDVQPRLKIIDPNEFNIVGPPSELESSKMKLSDRLGKKQTEGLVRERSGRKESAVDSSTTEKRKPKEEAPKRNIMDRLGDKTSSPNSHSEELDSWEKRASVQGHSVPEAEKKNPDVELSRNVKDRLGSRPATSSRERRPSPEGAAKPKLSERLGKTQTAGSRMVWTSARVEAEKDASGESRAKMSERLGRREAAVERPKMSDRLGKKLKTSPDERAAGGKERAGDKRALPHGEEMDMDESPRKRSLLSRVIAVQRAPQEEEAVDPNLAVASVIRVQPRPKVPAAMQANRNLLLKAMAEAQKSVAAAPVRALPEEPERKEGLFTHKYRDLGSMKINITLTNDLSGSAHDDDDEESERRTTADVRRPQNFNVTEDSGKPSLISESRRRQNMNMTLSQRLKEEEEIEAQKSQRPPSDRSNPSEHNTVSTSSRNNNIGSDHSKEDLAEELGEDDDEVLEEIYEEDEEDAGDVSLNASMGGSDVGDGDFKRYAAAEPDEEYVPTGVSYSADEEPELQQAYAADKRSVRPGDDTHFVVTLDCANPATYNPRKRTVEHRDHTERPASPLPVPENESVNEEAERNVSAVVYKRPRLSSSVEPMKAKERCKYWPACRQGEQCEFAHPSTPCKSFPACKFGDKCLYVHPNCKYDVLCTRRDCPYTHGAVRPASSALQAVKTSVRVRPSHAQPTCKFYPKCSNVNCPFLHPKPCRFGRSCTKVDCCFFHEDIPSAEKLKWVKTST